MSPSNSVPVPRTQSEIIKSALDKIGTDPLLVADCSKRYLLPIITTGQNLDLKEISPDTLVAVLKGEYNSELQGFEIIDCRYPYEYKGGHIQSAINLHTQRQVFQRYLASKGPVNASQSTQNGRFVLIFHCEFSSKRGPDMSRFLRDADRNVNAFSYPLVHYPEMYILSGGYKAFFQSHHQFCRPMSYLPMLQEAFSNELRLYRAQSKSEVVKAGSAGSLKRCHSSKTSLKRLYI